MPIKPIIIPNAFALHKFLVSSLIEGQDVHEVNWGPKMIDLNIHPCKYRSYGISVSSRMS